MPLLERYDEKMTQLEVQNKQAHKQRDVKVGPNANSERQVNTSLPPFNMPDTEPYGDNQSLKFGSQF
jgi:hypothetical protein